MSKRSMASPVVCFAGLAGGNGAPNTAGACHLAGGKGDDPVAVGRGKAGHHRVQWAWPWTAMPSPSLPPSFARTNGGTILFYSYHINNKLISHCWTHKEAFSQIGLLLLFRLFPHFLNGRRPSFATTRFPVVFARFLPK
jgi:hypothetical protein